MLDCLQTRWQPLVRCSVKNMEAVMTQEYADYQWSSKFEIGDPKIDEQHKGLVATMNSLLHALQTGGHRAP